MDPVRPTSIVEYLGDQGGHKCGYCKEKTGSYSHGMWAHVLSCEDYQKLVDRGWRRSGSYCYKPTMNRTCCPLYTIRCGTEDLQLNRSHKKVLKKVGNYLRKGCKKDNTVADTSGEHNVVVDQEMFPAVAPIGSADIDVPEFGARSAPEQVAKASSRVQKGKAKSLEDFLLPHSDTSCKHHLKLVLISPESDEFSQSFSESHRVYVKYQTIIHGDKESKCTEDQFERFLVKSPLQGSGSCGSFHQQYWLDGKLIAVGVLDVLPHCVSSVYFFYDPDYAFLSLGTYASLRELAFARSLNLPWYYLGFYIDSCAKMRYKGQYRPSQLLCPESYTWHDINRSQELLQTAKYSRLEESGQAADEDGSVDLPQVVILHRRRAITYKDYCRLRKNDDGEEVAEYARLVGAECAYRMLLYRK